MAAFKAELPLTTFWRGIPPPAPPRLWPMRVTDSQSSDISPFVEYGEEGNRQLSQVAVEWRFERTMSLIPRFVLQRVDYVDLRRSGGDE